MYRFIGGIPTVSDKIEYRENISKNIANELESEVFKGHSKDGPGEVFTRHRKLTFKDIIIIIIIFKSSIQRELDRFFKVESSGDFNIREVTNGDFTQARSKLNPEMFDKSIECRLVKVALEDGSYEILCTSLLDQVKNEYDEFKGLYHLHWNEEEAYKLLKSRVEVENFTGKTAKSVRQDFYAKILLMTLCAAYAHPIEAKVTAEYQSDKKRKHNQKINRTNALAMTQDIMIGMFIKRRFTEALATLDNIVEKTREIIRPDRSFY